MREYDLIAIGSGSAMNIVSALITREPKARIAVIDKDEPGGICLTRGCIPSKLLMYPAELVRTVETTEEFGIHTELKDIDFKRIMDRMRSIIRAETDMIRQGLSNSKNIDYYHDTAEFTAPYTLNVGGELIKSGKILLGTGSRPSIPPVKGLEKTGYLTSDTLLELERLPESIAIIGGGYIAAEYGHFFSAMGSKVTVIGRNKRLLPEEEPEISLVAQREFEKHMNALTSHEAREAERTGNGKKVAAVDVDSGKKAEVTAEEILVAAGRGPNSDILHPEKGGIKTDEKGWILANEYLETTQPGVWVLGDAKGKHQFKHAANYDSLVVYRNAIMGKRTKADYHAVPHAVFTHPEIAAAGLGENEAIQKYGEKNVLIGFHRYEATAKGEAMGVKDYFVKAILEAGTQKILGAHIIGPQASVLMQEIVNLMNTPRQTAKPIHLSMHIHPALSEVVQRAFQSLMPVERYHHMLEHHYGLRTG